MNPYFYLFYKLFCFLNKKGNNEWGTMYALTVFVGMNIIVVYSKILPITEENSQGGYKIGIGAILIALFITNYILFLHKNKYKQIIKLYKNESLRSRKTGSFVVIFYMVLSIAILILA